MIQAPFAIGMALLSVLASLIRQVFGLPQYLNYTFFEALNMYILQLYSHNKKVIHTTIYISGNIKRTIKADHILELSGLAILLLSFFNHICKINCKVV